MKKFFRKIVSFIRGLISIEIIKEKSEKDGLCFGVEIEFFNFLKGDK